METHIWLAVKKNLFYVHNNVLFGFCNHLANNHANIALHQYTKATKEIWHMIKAYILLVSKDINSSKADFTPDCKIMHNILNGYKKGFL